MGLSGSLAALGDPLWATGEPSCLRHSRSSITAQYSKLGGKSDRPLGLCDDDSL